MNILLAQVNPKVGDVQGNMRLICDVFEKHGADCDLIVFPELVLSGYPPEDLVMKPAFMAAIVGAVEGICALSRRGGAGMLISTPWRVGEFLYNTLLLVEGGEIRATIPKHHLPNYNVFDEPRVFKPGPMPEPVEFRGQKIGFMTCEDMWFADVAGMAQQRGASMLIVSNASPYELGKADMRIEMARLRAAETGLPLLYVNLAGGQDELVFDGCSFGMNSDGSIAFGLKAFESDTAMCRLDVGTWKADKDEDWPRDEASMYGALKLGLHDYVTKNGFPGVVLGLSGGVDSALVAALAVDALGADKVHAVMMPSPYTAQISLDDAAALVQNLGISYEIMPIEAGMRVMADMLGERATMGVTAENIQSRLRGVALMGISNATGRIVVSTGNKSEMAVGYATLYGDMCGGFAALKDVYKTDVFAICNWLNAQKPTIPERIITRPPSAELRDNQTDQDSLPPYAVLDDILEGLIEYDLTIEELEARGHDAAVIRKVAGLLYGAEYKRRQAAPGVKITRRAFGRDRRYPITNGFR